MEFGKLPEQELADADLSLPADPASNKAVLANGTGHTQFFVGCAKWGRKDWVGKFYPKGTKEADFLRYYGTQFNSIEFNGFFYNLHSKEQVRKWADAVPADFAFCPKFTQNITHLKRLKNTSDEVSRFFDVVVEFGNKLGPIFLLPHPGMGIKNLEIIEAFIAGLPADVPVFLELRHAEWFRDRGGFNKQMLQFLEEQKRGLVITDAAGRRDCAHMHLSTPECFIRFVGNGLHPTDYQRIDDWVKRLKKWMAAGLEKCFFFMHQHDELHSPELIRYFVEQMNKHCKTQIKLPVLYDSGTLF